MKKRLLVILMAAILMVAFLPIKASANSPEPTPFYTFYLSNLPEGTEYVDLLIFLPETDKMYAETITGNIPEGFSQNAQILTYCENDYRSYTFHYKDALSIIHLQKDGYVCYFTDNEAEWDEVHIRFDHADEIDSRGSVKLAMLDARGNILRISRLMDLTDVNKFSYRLGDFYYDAETGQLTIEAVENNRLDPIGHYLLSAVFGILITCLLEWAVSVLFDLREYRSLILCTNVVSQVLMRTAYAVLYLYSSWGYRSITLLLEGLVYLGEFFWYKGKMREQTWITCLGYTVCANIVSWLLGHLINLFVFFGAFIMI